MSHGDQFGELRSLLQGVPDQARWSSICAYVYAHHQALEASHWIYLHEHLKRWPLELCATPQDWIEALFDARGGPWLQICRLLRWDERDIEPDHVDELAGAPWLSGLEALSIARSRRPVWARYNLMDEGAMTLIQSESFDALRSLRLCGHHLRPDSVQRIVTGDRFPWLEHLDLSFNQLAFMRAAADAPWTLPRLQSLTLRDVELTFAGLEQLSSQAERLPALQSLDLSGHALGVEGVSGPLRGLPWANLSGLSLSGWGIGDAGALILAELLSDAVERLDLSYNELTIRGLDGLIAHHHGLRRVNLDGNVLSAQGLGRLLDSQPALEALSCVGCLLDPEQAARLLDDARLMMLQRLDLSGQPLQEAALSRLVEEAERAALVELKLAGAGLTDESALAFARSPALSRLEVLDLSQNRISASSLEAILESPQLGQLKRLIADGNPLEMTQAQALIRRHPRLEYDLQGARYALPDRDDEGLDDDDAWE